MATGEDREWPHATTLTWTLTGVVVLNELREPRDPILARRVQTADELR